MFFEVLPVLLDREERWQVNKNVMDTKALRRKMLDLAIHGKLVPSVCRQAGKTLTMSQRGTTHTRGVSHSLFSNFLHTSSAKYLSLRQWRSATPSSNNAIVSEV